MCTQCKKGVDGSRMRPWTFAGSLWLLKLAHESDLSSRSEGAAVFIRRLYEEHIP